MRKNIISLSLSSFPDISSSLLLPVSDLPGVGPKLASQLAKLNITTLFDLVTHLPIKAIDRRYSPNLDTIPAHLPPEGVVTLLVDILDHHPPVRKNRSRRRARPYRILCQQAGSQHCQHKALLDLVFFHADTTYLFRTYPIGSQRAVSGRIEYYAGRWTITHPDRVAPKLDQLQRIEPVYPLTSGLSSSAFAKIISTALNSMPSLPEWIHPKRLEIEGWPSWSESIHRIHRPTDHIDMSPDSPPRRRLAYDELLASQLMLTLSRKSRSHIKGRALIGNRHLTSQLNLPFALTEDQELAIAAIRSDMGKPSPMVRLLQGDVGSGKTIVALLAMLTAVEAGTQAALMVPTELLARQHYKNFLDWLTPLHIPIGLLTGRISKRDSAYVLEKLATGTLPIVIGTHALIKERLTFHDLGLVVIDEQHRFGVNQRLDLTAKASLHATDLLVTTATPIPRTQLLALYGDMSVTCLNAKPPGRLPITTRAIPISRVEDVIAGLTRILSRGEKAYWICPLITESENRDLETAEARYRFLDQRFPGRVGLLHGRMRKSKASIMKRFASANASLSLNKPIDLLVTTTIVEVGVDVPEASVMIIEHAERFGLAQLHQLRGRIGRGTIPSSCILLHNASSIARQRLSVLCNTEDGFHIAEEDLRLRGGGDLVGTRQSGFSAFRLVDWSFHANLLAIAREDALVAASDSHNDQESSLLLQIFQRNTVSMPLGVS